MKKNRLKSAYIYKIVMNVVIMISFIGAIFYYIYPETQALELKKVETLEIIEKYEKLESKGLNYNGLKSLRNSKKDDEEYTGKLDIEKDYLSKLMAKIDKIFYDDNFTLKDDRKYTIFLNKKEKEVNKSKEENTLNLESKKIDALLPIYSEGVKLDNSISNFGFINYLESLLVAFNVKTDGSFGVGDLVSLEGDTKGKQDKLTSKIFYIPIKFNITAKSKYKLLEFVYFLENVGSIKIEDEKIKVFDGKENGKNGILKNIIGIQKDLANYNLYSHQLATINYFKINEYIDDYVLPDNNLKEYNEEDFIKYIKNTQEKVLYKADMEVYFYVKGLPLYKIENSINDIASSYDKLKKEISGVYKKNNKRQFRRKDRRSIKILKNVRSLEISMEKLEKKVKSIRGGLRKKTNYEGLFYDANKLKGDVASIRKIFDQNNAIIKEINKNK